MPENTPTAKDARSARRWCCCVLLAVLWCASLPLACLPGPVPVAVADVWQALGAVVGLCPPADGSVQLVVGQIRLAAIMICGALSGLGGICFAYSISANFSSSIYVGYGYLAIAALIFGNWRILPTLGACLLFGFARSGGYRLVQVLQMPSSYQDLVMILPYVLTLLLLVFFSKQNGAPRALGVIYDKGAR